MFRLRTLCLVICAAVMAVPWQLGAEEPVIVADTNAPTAVFAVETNAPAKPDSTVETEALLRSVVKLQEQLRATRDEVERARNEAETTARHSERMMTDRLNFIEQKQVEMLRSSNRLVLFLVGAIAVITCFAVIIGGWLQMRAVTRLTEISHQLQMLPALAAPMAAHQIENSMHGEPSTDVDEHAAKLAEKVAQVQAKVDDIEHGAVNGNGGQNGGGVAATQIAKGQTLLTLNKPAEALECFERAIAVDRTNTEAWIKKGSALERLQQIDEAIAAYDEAIKMDEQIATAYLFKAGVYNRQKRYAEALQCYEKALNVQKTRAGA